jgi:DNA polymerase III delta subunit
MVRNLADQAKRFPESSLREGILKCHRTDLAIKKSRGPKNLLMEKLVIDLCRPKMT